MRFMIAPWALVRQRVRPGEESKLDSLNEHCRITPRPHLQAGGAGAPCYLRWVNPARRSPMALRINDKAPDFEAETTQGRIKFHDWIGDSYAILFSHPKDFTPVCTTELGYLAKLEPEFKKRNVKIIGLSVDPVGDHDRWRGDIREVTGGDVQYPMIGDSDLKVAKLYDMLPADAGDTSVGRTAATNATVRTVFIIGPDKLIKATLQYPMSSGRNFDEVLRLVDSIQLTANYKVATPVNWKHGEDVIIVPAVSDDDAKKLFPAGWKTVKSYLRVVPQPKLPREG
jgi:alkyl hydroperoxide reductase subunit AhpC